MRTSRLPAASLCLVGFASTVANAGESNNELMKEVSALGDDHGHEHDH